MPLDTDREDDFHGSFFLSDISENDNPFSCPETPEDSDVIHDTNPASTVTCSINRIERGSTKLSDKRHELLKPMFLRESGLFASDGNC